MVGCCSNLYTGLLSTTPQLGLLFSLHIFFKKEGKFANIKKSCELQVT